MRILFDSKQLLYKDPFGTLAPGQKCTLNIHIPATVQATAVECIINHENNTPALTVPMAYQMKRGTYEIFQGSFAFEERGLYFYYFKITTRTGSFRLFKQGDETNMEAGDNWQVSCIPEEFTVPQWAMGATMYQIFPDRFHKAGKVDLKGKLEPYTVHQDWYEDVDWKPNAEGLILNNDFYGGNFKGITEKLDYIASLGVNIIYLNPISKSFSNHRYDTGDYKTPDPMLGTEADFTDLCQAAHARGMKVILDGVYSHTGSNSLYFNKEGAFEGVGAYQSEKSPYSSWYNFSKWPDSYTCWWDFDTLPTANKLEENFVNYILQDADSVVAHWLKAGADGFRLDVVDELPNEFVDMLKKRIREIRPDAMLIGEVWEDASNKEAYGIRRRYFVDGELDSAMNYPFRTAILNFLREQDDGRDFRNAVMTIVENYPRNVLLCNMNLLGSHDTPRILTALVDDSDGSREENSKRRLSKAQYTAAQERLLMASFIQYTLPGIPSLYYGDEAGVEGYKDPFNRRTYPWGRENKELLEHFRRLGKLRQDCEPLRLGDIQFSHAGDQRLSFSRSFDGKQVKIYVNRSGDPWNIPAGKLLLGHNMQTMAPDWLTVLPMGFCIVEG